MPETTRTHREIVKIRREIEDIKRAQEADMHLNREKYEFLIDETIGRSEIRAKVFLAVDGLKSRKEIQEEVEGSQTAVWFALDKLECNGLVIKLESTKRGSPVYGKPRWIYTLRMEDYVKSKLLQE